MSWYTEHRPITLKQYIGEEVKEVVENRFGSEDTRPNVIMIRGERGCGKTTLARILAKYYQCEKPKADGTPCEECDTCVGINESLIHREIGGDECPGVQEIDATKDNGKNAVLDIMEEALKEPIYTKKNVVIFDECHEFSKAAQNSLLKVLEEAPKYLVVFLCTTNPEKVLNTVKSRCVENIEVKRATDKDMEKRLLEIAEEEGVQISKEAVKLIVKKRERVPRECISLLEKVAQSNGRIVDVAAVRKAVQDVNETIYEEFFEACNKGLEDVLAFNLNLSEKNIGLSSFMEGLAQYIMNALYALYGMKIEELGKDFISSTKRVFKGYDANRFDMLLKIYEKTKSELGGDGNKVNELLITEMALRIGKIELLVGNKTESGEKAKAQNEKADKRYAKSKKLDIDRNTGLEKVEEKGDITSIIAEVLQDSNTLEEETFSRLNETESNRELYELPSFLSEMMK
jgi:DNA polymerase-3 subunit gamma/tau